MKGKKSGSICIFFYMFKENDALLLKYVPCKTATLYINSQLFAYELTYNKIY